MNKKRLVGYIAFGVTMVYTMIGMSSQIWENYKNHSVRGLSLSMYILLCLTCTSWAAYATTDEKTDWFIFVPNSLGVLAALIVLAQFYMYTT